MQLQVLRDSVADSHRLKKTIRIQEAAIEVGEGQFRIRREFPVDQTARPLLRSPLKMVHAISLEEPALVEAHNSTEDH